MYLVHQPIKFVGLGLYSVIMSNAAFLGSDVKLFGLLEISVWVHPGKVALLFLFGIVEEGCSLDPQRRAASS